MEKNYRPGFLETLIVSSSVSFIVVFGLGGANLAYASGEAPGFMPSTNTHCIESHCETYREIRCESLAEDLELQVAFSTPAISRGSDGMSDAMADDTQAQSLLVLQKSQKSASGTDLLGRFEKKAGDLNNSGGFVVGYTPEAAILSIPSVGAAPVASVMIEIAVESARDSFPVTNATFFLRDGRTVTRGFRCHSPRL